MKIRKFKDADSAQICSLIKRNDLEIASKFYPREVINYWWKEITPETIQKKSKRRICFVVEENNKIIGYVSLSKDEIKKLFVLPELHRKGIGKRLMEEINKVAQENHLNKLIVYSTIYGEPFYKSCGFKKVKDSWKKADNHEYRFIYMEKTLK